MEKIVKKFTTQQKFAAILYFYVQQFLEEHPRATTTSLAYTAARGAWLTNILSLKRGVGTISYGYLVKMFPALKGMLVTYSRAAAGGTLKLDAAFEKLAPRGRAIMGKPQSQRGYRSIGDTITLSLPATTQQEQIVELHEAAGAKNPNDLIRLGMLVAQLGPEKEVFKEIFSIAKQHSIDLTSVLN